MMTNYKDEAIVLRSIDYRDNDKILSVFTKTNGRVELIAKGLKGKNNERRALTSPFSCVEIVYNATRSELHRLIDVTSLHPFLELREKLSFLQQASAMTKALLSSQLPGKPAPLLYALFRSYLKALSKITDPALLTASFYLKILRHEGMLSFTPFSDDEHQMLQALSYTTKLPLLFELSLPKELFEKIEHYFRSQYHR